MHSSYFIKGEGKYDVADINRKGVRKMCMSCPQKEKCEYVQLCKDCSQCQYAVKDDNGKVTACGCPPAKSGS
jgi:hypothetical protein